jgi:hypothetical protein
VATGKTPCPVPLGCDFLPRKPGVILVQAPGVQGRKSHVLVWHSEV